MASVVAAAPSNVRNRLAAIARSSGTYRTVLLQMLQDAVVKVQQFNELASELVERS